MAKVSPQLNRHYPSRTLTGPLHDDFRILYDHVYSLTDRLAKAEGDLREMTHRHDALSQQVANGPSTTKIAGLNVKAVVPQNGQQLTYNAATGDIEWQ
jgi:hypothetical protein